MQDTGPHIQRLANGTIDYDFYRAEAARERRATMQELWRWIGRGLPRYPKARRDADLRSAIKAGGAAT